MTRIEKMIKDGYPKIIKGNGGYRAYLKDMQPLRGFANAFIFASGSRGATPEQIIVRPL